MIPAIEELLMVWEAKSTSMRFLDYHDAIEDGIDKLNKYYCWFDLKPSIILSLGNVFFYLYFLD